MRHGLPSAWLHPPSVPVATHLPSRFFAKLTPTPKLALSENLTNPLETVPVICCESLLMMPRESIVKFNGVGGVNIKVPAYEPAYGFIPPQSGIRPFQYSGNAPALFVATIVQEFVSSISARGSSVGGSDVDVRFPKMATHPLPSWL